MKVTSTTCSALGCRVRCSRNVAMGYDGRVTRFTRIVCAAMLALAVSTVPLAADWCATVCESAHANATADAPACHHSSTVSRVGKAPFPCSHDHHPVVVDAAITIGVASRAMMALPFVTVESSASRSTHVTFADWSIRVGTPPPPLTLTLASILRI